MRLLLHELLSGGSRDAATLAEIAFSERSCIEMEQVLLVLTNLPDESAARALAIRLVEIKIAACVSYVVGVKSIFRWKGVIEAADEVTLMIKTTATRYEELQAAIRSEHPYEVPEIIAIPVAEAWKPYLEWVEQETKKDADV